MSLYLLGVFIMLSWHVAGFIKVWPCKEVVVVSGLVSVFWPVGIMYWMVIEWKRYSG